MKRILISILMIAVMIFPVLSFADEDQKTYKVTYNGSKLEDNFSESDFDRLISGMEPGDNVIFTVNVENNTEDTDWYISNSVLTSFEDNEKASGGAYSYRLAYKPASGDEKVLYSSVVGGESTVGGVGLHQVPKDMENFFYFDTLGNGAKGTVTLEVGLDGETQGNSYQKADSSLALQFAVAASEKEPEPQPEPEPEPQPEPEPEPQPEPEPEPEPDEEEPEEEPEDEPEEADDEEDEDEDEPSGKKSSEAKTGDRADMIPYAITLIAAGIMLFIVALINMRNTEKEGSGNEK